MVRVGVGERVERQSERKMEWTVYAGDEVDDVDELKCS